MTDLLEESRVNKWIAGILIGMISLIVGAGCGGGDASTTALTKGEFVKEANLICTKNRWEIRAASARMNRRYYQLEGVDTSSQPVNGDLEKKLFKRMVYGVTIPVMKERLEHFEELGAPAGDEAVVAKMLRTQATAIEELEEKGLAAALGSIPMLNFLREANAYGLDCSASYRPSAPQL